MHNNKDNNVLKVALKHETSKILKKILSYSKVLYSKFARIKLNLYRTFCQKYRQINGQTIGE